MSRFIVWTVLPVSVPGVVAACFSVEWGAVVCTVALAANLAGYAEALRFRP